MTLRQMLKRVHIVPRKLTAREIALSGVMAAVMAISAFIPVTVVAGVGKVISAAVMLEPLIGVLLGPVLGTYAAAGGAIVGQFIPPQSAIFGPFSFIPPTVGAATAGLLAHRRWKAASGVMVAVLLLWYSTSIGRQLYYYPYMPLIFLGFVLLFRSNLGEWIHVKYDEIVGFRGAGIKIMMIGLFFVGLAQAMFVIYERSVFTVGIVFSALEGVLFFGYVLTEDALLKRSSAAGFFVGAALLFCGVLVGDFPLILSVPVVLFCMTLSFLALILLGYESFNSVFLISFVVFGISAITYVLQGVTDVEGTQRVLQILSYILVITGIFLFLLVHLQDIQPLKKWSGILTCSAGFFGIMQQVLLLSSDSQIIKRELLQLGESIPFSTSVLGSELHITSVFDYYTKKVFPVYMEHTGLFLIFVALLIIGLSFFLNISLEKLTVAYFIIAGAAVLSDLMIGNFLAIQILELKAGMFKAFLFIYPVERMFMAFFATIFGVGVFIPLKKYGIINLIRR